MKLVDRDEVANYYIECELENIVKADSLQLVKDQHHHNTARLLEALSFTYRANGVFDYVENDRYQWEIRKVAVDDILLGGMGQKLTELIYSDEVGRSPRKFIDYFNSHQDDKRLRELKPRPVSQNRQIILLRQHEGTLITLDGSHRFLSMIMNGASMVTAYIATLVDKDAKPMIGDATFLRLRELWRQTNDTEFKQAIEQTILGMIAASSDGVQAVQAHWISMAPDEQVKHIGQELLDKLNNTTSSRTTG